MAGPFFIRTTAICQLSTRAKFRIRPSIFAVIIILLLPRAPDDEQNDPYDPERIDKNFEWLQRRSESISIYQVGSSAEECFEWMLLLGLLIDGVKNHSVKKNHSPGNDDQ